LTFWLKYTSTVLKSLANTAGLSADTVNSRFFKSWLTLKSEEKGYFISKSAKFEPTTAAKIFPLPICEQDISTERIKFLGVDLRKLNVLGYNEQLSVVVKDTVTFSYKSIQTDMKPDENNPCFTSCGYEVKPTYIVLQHLD
jgi:hypothetical protein